MTKFRPKFSIQHLPFIILILTVLPLFGRLIQPHSGFFYAPFYTNNLFTDTAMPAYQAGLRPEYRIVSVNHRLIDRLQAETNTLGAGGTLFLIWELGNIADIIAVKVETLNLWRLLEKVLPFVLIALVLYRQSLKNQPALLKAALGLAALAITSGIDYFFVSGAGLGSGFDPSARLAQADYLGLLAKWSAHLYFPLWSPVLAIGAAYFSGIWLKQRKKWRNWFWSVIALATFSNLCGHFYSAVLSIIYNNPNFTIFYSRGEFWLVWLPFSGFALLTLWLKIEAAFQQKVLISAGAGLFLTGYVAPTIFGKILLPAVGVQWWALLGVGLMSFKIKKPRLYRGKR